MVSDIEVNPKELNLIRQKLIVIKQISLYCFLPLRTMSRIWGKLNAIELPVHMRKAVLNTYIKSFGCNLDEALEQDLTHYKNLNEFFRRSLRPGVRPIDPTHGIVSQPSIQKFFNYFD